MTLPEAPLEELSPLDLLLDEPDLLEDFPDLLLVAFLADSYSERLSWPSLFLSYWAKLSASPEIERASSMLTAPLLSASALRKVGHSLELDEEDPPAPDDLDEPDAPEEPDDPAEPDAPEDPDADDLLLPSEDLLLLSAANADAETADKANTNVAVTADFIIPFILRSPISTDPTGAAGAPGRIRYSLTGCRWNRRH